ncbi:hypothetical protein ACFYWY_26730 [Streptomyces sp. NPDC002870]|uniref:hypothetical protein n=1 Tax=Streptomyces sp. NPDC002870 TaxID=3364666 RepID=UPI0036883D25
MGEGEFAPLISSARWITLTPALHARYRLEWRFPLVHREIDHLDGLLYTDRMKPGVEPIPVEEYRQTGLIYSCQASAQADTLWRHQVHEARGLSGAEGGARQ